LHSTQPKSILEIFQRIRVKYIGLHFVLNFKKYLRKKVRAAGHFFLGGDEALFIGRLHQYLHSRQNKKAKLKIWRKKLVYIYYLQHI